MQLTVVPAESHERLHRPTARHRRPQQSRRISGYQCLSYTRRHHYIPSSNAGGRLGTKRVRHRCRYRYRNDQCTEHDAARYMQGIDSTQFHALLYWLGSLRRKEGEPRVCMPWAPSQGERPACESQIDGRSMRRSPCVRGRPYGSQQSSLYESGHLPRPTSIQFPLPSRCAQQK